MIRNNPEAERWDDELFLAFYRDFEEDPIAEFAIESGVPIPQVGEVVHIEDMVDQAKGLTIELETREAGLFRVSDRVLEYSRNEAHIPDEDLESGEAKDRAEEMEHVTGEFFFVTVGFVVEDVEGDTEIPGIFDAANPG